MNRGVWIEVISKSLDLYGDGGELQKLQKLGHGVGVGGGGW